jgi:hypothetical protein
MPGARHPVVVRKRCIQLWLALATATSAADPVAVATSLELEFERRVPVPNVYRWVSDEAEHGFAESIRQSGAIVRTEMLELEAKRVKRSRIPAEVRLKRSAPSKRCSVVGPSLRPHSMSGADRLILTKYGCVYVMCCQDDKRRSVPLSEAYLLGGILTVHD